jgi:hypothetical protein
MTKRYQSRPVKQRRLYYQKKKKKLSENEAKNATVKEDVENCRKNSLIY